MVKYYPMHPKLSSEIPVLREISSALVRERNVRTLLETVLDILERRMGMLRGTVTLLEGDELRIEASRGLDDDERALGRYRIGEGITGIVAKSGKPEIVLDVRKDRRFLNRTKARRIDEALSFICVPLIRTGDMSAQKKPLHIFFMTLLNLSISINTAIFSSQIL